MLPDTRRFNDIYIAQKLENADAKLHESVEGEFVLWEMWRSNYMTSTSQQKALGNTSNGRKMHAQVLNKIKICTRKQSGLIQ
jgi:hypothetical protein